MWINTWSDDHWLLILSIIPLCMVYVNLCYCQAQVPAPRFLSQVRRNLSTVPRGLVGATMNIRMMMSWCHDDDDRVPGDNSCSVTSWASWAVISVLTPHSIWSDQTINCPGDHRSEAVIIAALHLALCPLARAQTMSERFTILIEMPFKPLRDAFKRQDEVF